MKNDQFKYFILKNCFSQISEDVEYDLQYIGQKMLEKLTIPIVQKRLLKAFGEIVRRSEKNVPSGPTQPEKHELRNRQDTEQS